MVYWLWVFLQSFSANKNKSYSTLFVIALIKKKDVHISSLWNLNQNSKWGRCRSLCSEVEVLILLLHLRHYPNDLLLASIFHLPRSKGLSKYLYFYRRWMEQDVHFKKKRNHICQNFDEKVEFSPSHQKAVANLLIKCLLQLLLQLLPLSPYTLLETVEESWISLSSVFFMYSTISEYIWPLSC